MGASDLPSPKPGTARCHGTPYSEMIAADTRDVPDILATDRYRYLGDEDLAVDRYVGAEHFKLEAERMWPKVWQMACRLEEIPYVGDYIVYEILNFSVIVVRTKQDQIKAYYNSCLHRGRQLVTENGNGRAFTCPYHGFSWNIDGSSRYIPCEWDFPHLKDRDMHLPEVRLDTWQGFVFVNFDDNAISLQEYLSPLDKEFARWDLEGCTKIVHVAKIVRANWKVVSEAFMESFHAMQTHPQIAPFTADTNARYDILGDHTNANIAPMGEPSPFIYKSVEEKPSDQDILDTLTSLSGRVTSEDKLMLPAGQSVRAFMAESSRQSFQAEDGHDYSNRCDAEMLDALVFNVFPNFSPWGGFPPNVVYRWRPNGWDVDSTIMEVLMLKRNPSNGEELPVADIKWLDEDQDWASAEEVGALGPIFDQDMANLSYVQKGMKASHRKKVSLANYQEVRVRHFHQIMDRYLYES